MARGGKGEPKPTRHAGMGLSIPEDLDRQTLQSSKFHMKTTFRTNRCPYPLTPAGEQFLKTV